MHIINWQYFDTAEDVAQYTVRQIILAAHQQINSKGEFRLVLAGGTTPAQVYQILADHDEDWSRWKLFLGDERCLPEDDAERNSLMVTEAWLDKVHFPRENFFPIAADKGPEQGAREYAQIVQDHLPFDVVLLGMGEDGHTASLFPDVKYNDHELIHAVYDAPKPPPERISMSKKTLAQTGQLFILVTGKSKQAAVHKWQHGEPLPVAQITAPNGINVLIDDEATPDTNKH